ncbi:MAG: uroporphyrinogen decarboxylase family protein, partial [Acidobacteriaceae bacterium]
PHRRIQKDGPALNGRQRIDAALHGRWPDRTPVMLHNFMMAACEAGVSMRQFRDDPRLIARCFGEAVERYQLDGIMVDIDTVTLAGAVGVPIDFPEDNPARSRGACLPALEAVRDLEPVDISKDPRIQILVEAVAILVREYGNEIFIRGNCDQSPFSLAGEMRGLDQWLMDVASQENDELVHRLLGYCTGVTCQLLRLMAETGAHMLSNGDSPAGPDMLSPRFYGTYALPYERRLAACSHELGLPYLLHICGKTDRILQQMVMIEADALEIDYKTNLQMAHDTLKGSVTFVGNIDPSGVLARGTPELVRQRTQELLDTFADNPRFILNSGCALPADTPPENIRAMLACVRNHSEVILS